MNFSRKTNTIKRTKKNYILQFRFRLNLFSETKRRAFDMPTTCTSTTTSTSTTITRIYCNFADIEVSFPPFCISPTPHNTLVRLSPIRPTFLAKKLVSVTVFHLKIPLNYTTQHGTIFLCVALAVNSLH